MDVVGTNRFNILAKITKANNFNIDPTSPTIQVPTFGNTPKGSPFSLQFATCAHKKVESALNKKLKTVV
jgi:hypothetical protein